MSRKYLFTLSLILFAATTSPPAFAASIPLKSGKVITGQMLEETDEFIRIQDENGQGFKIRKNQIREDYFVEKNGAVVAAPKTYSSKAILDRLAEQLSKEDWQKRIEVYKEYFNKVGALEDQFMRLISYATPIINKAVHKDQYSKAWKEAEKTKGHLVYLQQEIAKLKPSLEELQSYHEAVAKTIDYYIIGVDAWMIYDADEMYINHRRSMKAFLASLEEYQAFHETLGTVTKQEIKFIDELVSRIRESINKVFY